MFKIFNKPMKKSYTLHTEIPLYSKESLEPQQTMNTEKDIFLPGKHVIQNLINYSKSLNIIKSQSIGSFGLISN
jgi:hypothetical protein